MRLVVTDHMICFRQSHGLFTTRYKFLFAMSKHLIRPIAVDSSGWIYRTSAYGWRELKQVKCGEIWLFLHREQAKSVFTGQNKSLSNELALLLIDLVVNSSEFTKSLYVGSNSWNWKKIILKTLIFQLKVYFHV